MQPKLKPIILNVKDRNIFSVFSNPFINSKLLLICVDSEDSVPGKWLWDTWQMHRQKYFRDSNPRMLKHSHTHPSKIIISLSFTWTKEFLRGQSRVSTSQMQQKLPFHCLKGNLLTKTEKDTCIGLIFRHNLCAPYTLLCTQTLCCYTNKDKDGYSLNVTVSYTFDNTSNIILAESGSLLWLVN